ncbi:MAG: NUDIX hydrolase [uncultured bacterium (gcode 4)]|uniref:NUDIX hydrolase n=1 Tax=uncultured bacterium (gcode 4) TaxID=1234023 RepID=K2H254_9BACT|nr:MAG: NUDIX hydrolase [uncultured bacterium (gcode 4)]
MKIPKNAIKVFDWIIFDSYQWEQELYDWSIKIFEWLKRNDTADVIALSENWNIFVLEQEQPGREPFYTFPWWCAETWEDPYDLARRELLEETWLETENLELYKVYNNSSKISYDKFFFIARNCRKVQKQKLDWWEKIKVIEVDWNWLMDIVSSPKFALKEFALDALSAHYNWEMESFKNNILN